MAVARFGWIDVVVNNAGILRFSGIETCTDEQWEQVIGINLGAFSKGFAPSPLR